VSPNSSEIVETDATDLLMRPEGFLELLHADDRPSLDAALGAAEDPPFALSWEGRLVLPSSRVGWFRISARRVEVARHGTRWCGYMVEITEQRLLEEQLKQRGRLATIGQLAAGVAHEINNPLSYVIGNTRYVLEAARSGEASLPPDLTEALADAVEGGQRVARIVQDLRTLALGGEIGEEPGPVDLGRVLRTAARQVEIELRFRARLVWELPDDIPVVHGHEDRLVQVFYNLLKNAGLAIPPGDPVRNEVRLRVTETPVFVSVNVIDTGPGVPERVRERIFDPFFTTRDGTTGGAQGQGLGLSVCLSIVNRLGGSLALEEAGAGGACFTVRLLRSTGVVSPLTVEPPAPVLDRRLHLLVVDDEPGVLRSLQRSLAPHSVDVALGGAEALAMLKDDTRYDALVCDVMMPGMSGVEVYERVTELYPALARRFLFLTGGTVSEDVRGWLDATRVPLLEKPASAERVLVEIAGLVQAPAPLVLAASPARAAASPVPG
jgi:signal transduction histidine kinase/CheY-like chemotaxis protein